jgi:diguanylate cyclase (GGDEF)-like protein
MLIAHSPYVAFPLVLPLTMRGTAIFAITALILLFIASLLTGIGKKVWLKLRHVGSSFVPSNFVSDDSGMRLKEMIAALENSSIRDDLTGLYNRRHFFETFEMEWTRAAQDSHHLAIIMIDIDDFQQLTETCGQAYIDCLLHQFARSIERCAFRIQDVVACIGPAEFALILPGSHLADSREMAESIRTHVPQIPLSEDGASGPLVTVSIGGTCCIPQYRGSPANMLQQADLALKQASAKGANQICFVPADEQADLAYEARTHLASHLPPAPVEEEVDPTLDQAAPQRPHQVLFEPGVHQPGPALDEARTHRTIPMWREPMEEKAGLTLDELRAHAAWIASQDQDSPVSELTGANRR